MENQHNSLTHERQEIVEGPCKNTKKTNFRWVKCIETCEACVMHVEKAINLPLEAYEGY